FFWEGSDPDGINNLDHYELCFNDTASTPVVVPSSITQAAFVAKDILTSTPDCEIYSGTNQKLSVTIKGLALNSNNIFYVRAVDRVGAKSPYAASYTFYCKKPVNKILLVNASYPFTPAKLNFFHTGMQNVGVSLYDTLNAYKM